MTRLHFSIGVCCALISWEIASAQTDYSLPANTGAIDVSTLGARGNDTLNDEKIIEKAIQDNQDALRQIYLPAGTYYVNGTIGDMDSISQTPIPWDRFYTLRGAGVGRTVIRLRNSSAGFQDSAAPKPVILCWNRVVRTDRTIPWEGTDEGNPDESNDCHSIHIMHLTIDVGDNNPGAVGLDFSAHNGGGVEDVEIVAGTNSGKIGLALNRKWPGPSLINDVKITGFDYGVFLRYHNYTMTLEDITLQNQRIVGILHENHSGCIRNITSTNTVPAVRNIGLQGMLVLLDCNFSGGSSSVCAIENSDGLFARNITTSGYQAALKHEGTVMTNLGATITEFMSEPWHCALTASPRRSLGLTIKETPVVPWEAAASWKSIETYVSAAVGGDWALAVNAAIQAGAVTLYLPNRGRYQTYAIKQATHLNGTLRRIVGLSSSLGGNKLVFDNTDASSVLELEQVRFDSLEHRSPGSLVLRRCLGSNITTFTGAGDLFIEDFCGDKITINGTNVWARQLNSESDVFNIRNTGGKLWILGYKTEKPKSVLINTNSAQTEILGGQVYPVLRVPDTIPMYINSESALSTIHSYNHWYQIDTLKYPYLAREIQSGVEQHVDSMCASLTSYPRLKTVIYVSNPAGVGTGSDTYIAGVKRGIVRTTASAGTPVFGCGNGRIFFDVSGPGAFEARLVGPGGRTMSTARGSGPSRVVFGQRSLLSPGIYVVDVQAGDRRVTGRVVVSR